MTGVRQKFGDAIVRVVFTGAESTGKSTTAGWTAERFGAALMPEYLRTFVDEAGRLPQEADIEAIAGGHLVREAGILQERPAMIVYDTDLLSLVIYARHYFGTCPHWIEEAASARAPDIYLLMGDEVPWTPDPGQRDGPEVRTALQDEFRHRLAEQSVPFVELRGDFADRCNQVTEHVVAIIKAA